MKLEEEYFEQIIKLKKHIEQMDKLISSLKFKNGELKSELDELRHSKNLNELEKEVREKLKKEYSKNDYVSGLLTIISDLKYKNRLLKRN